MAEKKMCPHCGGHMFMAKAIRACVVEVTTDPNQPYNVLKESKDSFDIEILKCARCKEDVSETDLVTGVKCRECGRIVGPMDINEEGICNVCDAVKQRTELASASREDLIKMLLDAEKKANPVVAKMEKQIEKADNASVTTTETTEDIQENTESSSDENTEDKKPKRRAARKKKDDATEEDVASEMSEVSSEENNVDANAVDNIANQQEAPFPDIAMNPPVEENAAPVSENAPVSDTVISEAEEQPIGADFRMFEEEDAF